MPQAAPHVQAAPHTRAALPTPYEPEDAAKVAALVQRLKVTPTADITYECKSQVPLVVALGC